jgi:hypothetical protein
MRPQATVMRQAMRAESEVKEVWCGVVGAATRLRNKRAGGPDLTTSGRIETRLTLFESGTEVD